MTLQKRHLDILVGVVVATGWLFAPSLFWFIAIPVAGALYLLLGNRRMFAGGETRNLFNPTGFFRVPNALLKMVAFFFEVVIALVRAAGRGVRVAFGAR